MATIEPDYGAFVNKLVLQPIPPPPSSSSQALPLKGLTFAVKDIFDVEGQVTGFGNPDWARTHSAATSTAPAVLDVLKAGATCIGKTVMDEMAYSINGENKHYGTPRNPCAADRLPGGSSSGSAVAVGAKLVDFSLGSDTGGSVRVPASYCGIFGFRPSHNLVSTKGVIPMVQSCDTVGWFARDPHILKKVGYVLLQVPESDPVPPSQIIISDDCFELSTIPLDWITKALINSVEKSYKGLAVKHQKLGAYVEDNVPALNSFLSKELLEQSYNIPSLAALSSAYRLLERYEFKLNHAEWINSVNPDLGPGISERIREALNCTDEKIDVCIEVKKQLAAALSALLEDRGILVIPTVVGPPPKLQTDASTLQIFRARDFSVLSISGLSEFCQVSIPLGMHEGLPVSVSLLARHGSDGFLLDVVETLYDSLKEQVVTA